MLAVSPLRNPKNEREGEMEGFSLDDNEFHDFSGGNLLDSIDFDDLLFGISDGDVLPDLEMDPELLADFSVSASEESEVKMTPSTPPLEIFEDENSSINQQQQHIAAAADVAAEEEEEEVCRKEADKGRKSMAPHSKNPHGKRKVKKYRSHRKHLLAREAEAASWSQRRQIYGGAAAAVGGGAGNREHVSPWIAPTMGFPPVTPMPPPHFRPLHVWGHPSVDQSMMPMWPKHLTPPPHAWHPPPPPPHADHSFWMPHHHHVPTQGTPCFPPHLPPPTRHPAPPVSGIPPPAMYKVEQGAPPPGQTLPQPPSDVHPSKESVDAAIGDVLSKPWLPLPLGLKPPSVDGVMVELQRQGISKVPPTCA